MSKNITPEDLLEDLQYLQKIKNPRLLILYLDLYFEYFIHKLHKEAKIDNTTWFSKKIYTIFNRQIHKEPSAKVKIKALVEHRKIDAMFLDITLLVFKLRHKLVHNLRPNMELVGKWIDEHEPSMEDKTGLIKKFLSQADPWEKIQLYAFPAIISFYRQLKALRGEVIDYNLEFHIQTDAKAMQITLLKNK